MIILLLLIIIAGIALFINEVFKPNYNDEWDNVYLEFNIYNYEIENFEKNVIEYYRKKGIYITRQYKSNPENKYTRICRMSIQGPKDVILNIENSIMFAFAEN